MAAKGYSGAAAAGSLLPRDIPRARLCVTQKWDINTKLHVSRYSTNKQSHTQIT